MKNIPEGVDKPPQQLHRDDRVNGIAVELPHHPGQLTDVPFNASELVAESLEVRLHTPTPEVVLLRVSGDVDAATADALAVRAGQQLHRAQHLVIDLAGSTFLGIRGLDVLRALHERATAAGTHVHVAAPHHAVSRPLQVSGLDRLVAVETSAEMIVALLTAHLPGLRVLG